MAAKSADKIVGQNINGLDLYPGQRDILIIMDGHGVLFDSKDDYLRGMNKIFEMFFREQGISLEESEALNFAKAPSLWKAFEDYVIEQKRAQGMDVCRFNETDRKNIVVLLEMYMSKQACFPGMPELCRALKEGDPTELVNEEVTRLVHMVSSGAQAALIQDLKREELMECFDGVHGKSKEAESASKGGSQNRLHTSKAEVCAGIFAQTIDRVSYRIGITDTVGDVRAFGSARYYDERHKRWIAFDEIIGVRWGFGTKGSLNRAGADGSLADPAGLKRHLLSLLHTGRTREGVGRMIHLKNAQ
ncbi:MAG TPA: hypothetical protein VIT68_04405 [Candidatus Gracilibacteria bacterium]